MPRAHLRPPDAPKAVPGPAASSACEGEAGAEAPHGFPETLSTSLEGAAAMEWAGEGKGGPGWQQRALGGNSCV